MELSLTERIKNLRYNIQAVTEEIKEFEIYGAGELSEYEANLQTLVVMKQNLKNMESIVYGTGEIFISLTREEIELVRNILRTSITSKNMDAVFTVIGKLERGLRITRDA